MYVYEEPNEKSTIEKAKEACVFMMHSLTITNTSTSLLTCYGWGMHKEWYVTFLDGGSFMLSSLISISVTGFLDLSSLLSMESDESSSG